VKGMCIYHHQHESIKSRLASHHKTEAQPVLRHPLDILVLQPAVLQPHLVYIHSTPSVGLV
jgi:hypothetical protein